MERIFKRRYKLIACEILFREVCFCAAMCDNIIDIVFVEKGLHDIGDKKMSERLQQEIDNVDTAKYDAILLCYGLCNNGICNLRSSVPIVVPKAHDCITLLMGSKDKYKEYFDKNPGTFFKSPGWIERDVNPNDTEGSTLRQLGLDKTYDEYVELYGEENAEFLKNMLGNWVANYKKIAFINTKVGNTDTDRKIALEFADNKQWEYEEVDGDTRLVLKLLNGEWDEGEFLVVPPGNKIQPSNDDDIVRYKEIEI